MTLSMIVELNASVIGTII